jgi:predicted unusual protein kinase regulating ubiquinone biosynthesis (AarF/ABC1/UbiB family)
LIISFRRDWARWVYFGAPVPRSPAFHQRRADRIARTLAELGPTFIKMAQLIGSRVDLFPEPYVGAMASLMDRVPATPWPKIEREIRRSYGRPADAVFDRIDPVPMASASIGQVHHGWVGGRHVAVKVLRPGVDRLVSADVIATGRLLVVVERLFPRQPRVLRAVRQIRAVLAEFAYRVRDEMDYRREAEHAIEIRDNFAGTEGITVPEVLVGLVRQRVLVMEYMEGDPLDALDARVAAGEIDVTALVRRLIEAYTTMMMIDGLFQADPHPRNLKVAPNGDLVLLDFGMVVRVSREMRRALLDTIMASIAKDVDRVVADFERLGLLAPEATRDDLRPLIAVLLDIASRDSTTIERIELLSDKVMGNLYDSPVNLPSSLVYFARTAALIEGIGARYDPHFAPIKVAAPVVLRLEPQIVAALARTHRASPGDWIAGLARLGERVVDQLFSALAPPSNGHKIVKHPSHPGGRT